MSESHSDRRFRLARKAVAFGVVERVVTAAASFLRVPLLLWGLSLHDYGVWAAILGLVSAANLLDFGLHFGVTNAVSRALGRDDRGAVGRTTATAFVLYSTIAAFAMATLAGTYRWLPLGEWVGVAGSDAVLAGHVALLGVATVVLPMPFKVYAAALTGFQEQWSVSVFRTALSVGQLALLAVAFFAFGSGLLGVAWIGLASEMIAWAAFAGWVEWRRPELGVRPRLASPHLAPALLRTGAAFLAINVANLFRLSLGSTLVAHGRGPEEVATFSVPLGLFTIAYGLAALVVANLWPAFGEAGAREDWGWIRRAFALGTKVSVGVASALALLGALFGSDVIRLWAPKAGTPPRTLMLAFGVWLVAQVGVNAASTLLNGLGHTRAVLGANVLEGAVVFAASLATVRTWGATGVAAIMAAAAAANAAFQLFAATPWVTRGRVTVSAGPVVRMALGVATAAVVARILDAACSAAGPTTRLLLGAAPTVVVLAFALWWIALGSPERERLRSAWARGRRADKRPGDVADSPG